LPMAELTRGLLNKKVSFEKHSIDIWMSILQLYHVLNMYWPPSDVVCMIHSLDLQQEVCLTHGANEAH